MKFVESADAPPKKGIADFEVWKENDCLVIAWILNSIHKDYADSFILASSTRSLWKELEQRYGDNNALMLFKLKRQLGKTVQGNLSVCNYFSTLKRLWDEIYQLRPTLECQCGAIKEYDCNTYKRMIDMAKEDKLMEFLSCLNEGYGHVINQILLSESLPNVNKAFSMILKIEKQKELASEQQIDFAHYSAK